MEDDTGGVGLFGGLAARSTDPQPSLERKLLVTGTGVVLSTTDANDDLDDGEESQLKGPIDLLAPYT